MSKEKITLALEALLVHEYELRKVGQSFKVEPAIKALEEALAKQEQGEHKESVRLECVVCKTVYEDGVPPQVAKQEQGEPVAQSLKDAVFTVLEGFTLDSNVRKILESAYYTTPQPAQKPLTNEFILQLWEAHIIPVFGRSGISPIVFARAIEAAHDIKE